MSSVERTGSPTRPSADRSQPSDRDGSSTADTLQHQAGRVTDEVREQAVSLGEDARQQLHEQAKIQTEHLGATLDNVADRLHALADGRPEEAGQARDLLDRVADQVGEISQRIDELGFDGSIDELQRFARRRPGVFLASAAALGFAGSRLAQGAKADRDGSDGGSQAGNEARTGETQPSAARSDVRRAGLAPTDPPPTATSGPSTAPVPAAAGRISGPAAREDGR